MNNDGGTTDIDERQLSMTDSRRISVHFQEIKTSTTASSFLLVTTRASNASSHQPAIAGGLELNAVKAVENRVGSPSTLSH